MGNQGPAAQEQKRMGGYSLTFMQPRGAESTGGEDPVCITSKQKQGRVGGREGAGVALNLPSCK